MSLKIVKYIIYINLFLFIVSFLPAKKLDQNFPIAIPLEKNKFAKLTSYKELIEFITELDKFSKNVKVDIIGKSVEGRDIHAAFISEDKKFGSNRSVKPVVLLFAQQHGNEPSGKEAALKLIFELTTGLKQKLLQFMDIIIVPQVNPDGSEKDKRRNANGIDLNRNHAILSEPESYAIHKLFLKWMPEVTIDIHETNVSKKSWFSKGYMKDAEELLDSVSNLNISPEIRDISDNIIIPQVGKLIRNDGFRFSRYIVGGPSDKRRIRHSTTNINDGRQSMGIYNTLSFVLEGKRFGNTLTNIERRTAGQLSAMTAILKIIAEYRKKIRNVIHSEREALCKDPENDKKFIATSMDYYPDKNRKTFSFPIFDLYSWQHTKKELTNYEPLVKIKYRIEKPVAYIFSKKRSRLIKFLHRHQIEMYQLKRSGKIKVEVYNISGINKIQEEDKDGNEIKVIKRTESLNFKKGDIIIYNKQKAANLIPLLLEPQSSWGIVTERSGRKYKFDDYIKIGEDYPIYRIKNKIKSAHKLLK